MQSYCANINFLVKKLYFLVVIIKYYYKLKKKKKKKKKKKNWNRARTVGQAEISNLRTMQNKKSLTMYSCMYMYLMHILTVK